MAKTFYVIVTVDEDSYVDSADEAAEMVANRIDDWGGLQSIDAVPRTTVFEDYAASREDKGFGVCPDCGFAFREGLTERCGGVTS